MMFAQPITLQTKKLNLKSMMKLKSLQMTFLQNMKISISLTFFLLKYTVKRETITNLWNTATEFWLTTGKTLPLWEIL